MKRQQQFENALENAPVLRALRELSSGTISTLAGVYRYGEIDAIRSALEARVKKWLEQGVLEPNDMWQRAWNLFVSCHLIHRDMPKEDR